MSLLSEFYFRPVGKGGFYTGRLQRNGRLPAFHMVYDCGTSGPESTLNSEIKEFKPPLNNILDLLMISHFHQDHINGVIELLSAITCKRLVIPYYEPEERLLLYATTSDASEDFRLMLIDPIGYFGNRDKFKIDEIVVVGLAPGYINDGINQSNDKPILDNDGEWQFSDGNEQGWSKLPDWMALQDKERGVNVSNKVRFKEAPYGFSVGGQIWEFIFFLEKWDDIVLKKHFTEDVNLILGGRSIFKLFEAGYITPLKRAYSHYFAGDLNSSSLVVYHAPAFHKFEHVCITRGMPGEGKEILCYHFPNQKEVKLATLLTGDIGLETSEKIEAMTTYLRVLIDKVSYFQIPHHGSDYNWLINPYPHQLHQFENYVVNHRDGSTTHPSARVLDNIQKHAPHAIIHHNTQKAAVIYSYQFFFDYDYDAGKGIDKPISLPKPVTFRKLRR